jgi:8-oxo-dGTP pyrophosphatase MutT (NUDIX family)
MPISPYLRALREKVGTVPLMVPAVCALIVDERDRVLLHRATDDGRWHTIGGSIDPGEEIADAAVREAREETGLAIEPLHLVGVYTDPPVTYANGDVVLYISFAFECRIVGGEMHVADDESLELRFFSADELPDDLRDLDRHRIVHALKRQERAEFRLSPSPYAQGEGRGKGSSST